MAAHVLCVMSMVAFGSPAFGSTTPAPHPNHYVFLVDSSGSARGGLEKARDFNTALTTAVDRLYRDGYGVIPKADPAADVVSVLHFGIVPDGPPLQAYRRLKNFTFPTDFIHPFALREQDLSPAHLRELLQPRTSYRLTLLVLAKPLALETIKPRDAVHAGAARTFLIVVRDWLINDQTLRDELSMIKNSAPRQYATAATIRETIDARYDFSAPLWTQDFGPANDEDRRLTIEVSEITSRNTEAWRRELDGITRLAEASFQWTGTREGDVSIGTLSLSPSEELRRQVLDVPGSQVSLRVDGRPVPLVPSWQIPVAVKGCNVSVAEVELSAAVTSTDEILGVVGRNVWVSTVYPLPVPSRCTLTHRILLICAAIAGLVVLAAAIYWTIYTRYRTHVFVTKPVGLRTWRLRWDRSVGVREIVAPKESEVLRVHLPGAFLNATVYRKAELVIESDPPHQFQWNRTGENSIRMNAAGKEAIVRRRDGSSSPAGLSVSLRKKKQRAVFQQTADPEVTHV